MSDASYILQRKGFISMDTHKIAPKILGGGQSWRDTYIDWCRATAFILVVLHHSGIGKFGKYILGFHMPVFFIITGFTFKTIQIECRPVKGFLIKRTQQLVIPYFVFEVLNYGLTRILERVTSDKFRTPIVPVMKSILYCINNNEYIGVSLRLWFLPCMVLASSLFVISVYIGRKIKYDGAEFCILFASLIGSWVVTNFVGYRLPFTVDISLLAVFYITLGYITKERFYMLRKIKSYYKTLLLVIVSLMYIFFVHSNSGNFYMYENTYGDYGLAILGSICGSVAFFLVVDLIMPLVEKVKSINCIITWINHNSIIMFPVHLEVLFFIGNFIDKSISVVILSGFIKAIIVMVVMVPIINMINCCKEHIVKS